MWTIKVWGHDWGCVQACLRLTKAQKDDIAALYKEHLQEAAATHQICLSIASKVQVLDRFTSQVPHCASPEHFCRRKRHQIQLSSVHSNSHVQLVFLGNRHSSKHFLLHRCTAVYASETCRWFSLPILLSGEDSEEASVPCSLCVYTFGAGALWIFQEKLQCADFSQ